LLRPGVPAMITLAWTEPYFGADLHLVTGLSGPRLDRRLTAIFRDDSTGDEQSVRGDQLPGWLRFTFPAAPPPEGWAGIGMDQATGQVWLPSDVPAEGKRRVRYFIVTVTLVVRVGGTEEVADPLYLQVWSHNGVDAVWLTPDGLTARQGCDPVRFSL